MICLVGNELRFSVSLLDVDSTLLLSQRNVNKNYQEVLEEGMLIINRETEKLIFQQDKKPFYISMNTYRRNEVACFIFVIFQTSFKQKCLETDGKIYVHRQHLKPDKIHECIGENLSIYSLKLINSLSSTLACKGNICRHNIVTFC